MSDKMPRVVAHESDWSAEQVIEFNRRRRGRNFLLLGVLGGIALLIYAIALVKLHEYGQMW
jgi:hypothetical protein